MAAVVSENYETLMMSPLRIRLHTGGDDKDRDGLYLSMVDGETVDKELAILIYN